MATIGIDLGTTNSLVSIWKDNKINLIPNIFDNNLTPSVVSFDNDNTLYVGQVARERLISKPDSSVSSFKRYMGTNHTVTLNNKRYSPEELSSFILRQLKEDAERYLGEPVTEAVISVPAYFNDDQRQATKNAAALAGLHVERLVNEPSAAALAGRTLFEKNDSLLLVIDLGGGTLDVSVVECFENIVSVIAVSGDNHLGGDDFNLAIAEYFCKKNNLVFSQIDVAEKEIILKNAEKCKIALSKMSPCTLTIETPKIKASLSLTRKDFVTICGNLLARIKTPIQRALIDADISADEIDEIILVGGSSKMKIVKDFITHILGKEPLYIGNADETVAIGVGIYAGIKDRNEDIKDLLLTDICPFSLGIGISNHENSSELLFSPIIERNTVLPVNTTERYTAFNKSQKKVDLEIFQGEHRLVSRNVLLGKLEIVLARDNNKDFDVCFIYDLNGILNIEVTLVATGVMQKMTLLSSNNSKNLSEKEIKEKVHQLEKVKKKSKEEEQMQFMIETANAMYEQTIGDKRDLLNERTSEFIHDMKNQSKIKKLKTLKLFAIFLNAIAESIAFNPLDEEIDVSWYVEEE